MVHAVFAALAQTVKQTRRVLRPAKSAVQLTDAAAERIKHLLQSRQKARQDSQSQSVTVSAGVSEAGSEEKRV